MEIVRLDKDSAFWPAAGVLLEDSYADGAVNPLSFRVEGEAWAAQVRKAHSRLRAVHVALKGGDVVGLADATVSLLAPQVDVRRLGIVENIAWRPDHPDVISPVVDASLAWLATVADVGWVDAPQLATAPPELALRLGLEPRYNRYVMTLPPQDLAAP